MSGSVTIDKKVLTHAVSKTILIYVQGAHAKFKDYRFGVTIRDLGGQAIYNVVYATLGAFRSPDLESMIGLPNREVDRRGGPTFIAGWAFAPRAFNQVVGSGPYCTSSIARSV